MSGVIGKKSLVEWIPLFVKLMNSGEEVLAGFCALELKVFKIKVRTSLAGSSLLSVLREQTREFLLCKYPKVVRFQAVSLTL